MWSPDLREIVFLSLFVVVPAGFLIFVRPVARWVFFALGLVFMFGIGFLVDIRGGHNPNAIFQLVGAGVALGALLVEAIAFPVRRWRRRREAEAP